MRLRRILAAVLVMAMMASAFACAKKETLEETEETEISEETLAPTNTAVPTARPTNTPRPTATPTPGVYINALEVYQEFVASYSQTNSAATYVISDVNNECDEIVGSYLSLTVFNGNEVDVYGISSSKTSVSGYGATNLFSFTLDEFTSEVEDEAFSDLVSEQKAYDPNSKFVVKFIGDKKLLVVKSDGLYSVFVKNNEVDVLFISDDEGFSSADFLEDVNGHNLEYVFHNSTTVSDGRYFGNISYFEAGDSGATVTISEDICWANITATGYAPNGLYYFDYNGERHFEFEVDDDARYFIGEYSEDFQNREGAVIGSSDLVLLFRYGATQYVPFASDCEIYFSGPWSAYYNGDEFDSELRETPVYYNELSTTEDLRWAEYQGLDGFGIIVEPVVISNGQIVSVTLGVR